MAFDLEEVAVAGVEGVVCGAGAGEMLEGVGEEVGEGSGGRGGGLHGSGCGDGDEKEQ